MSLQGVWEAGVSLLFPRSCLCCGVSLDIEARLHLCPDCGQGLFKLGTHGCRRCGYPCVDGGSCDWCSGNEFAFEQARSLFVYAGWIRDMLHGWKFRKDRENGILLKELFRLYHAEMDWMWSAYDWVVPVPLHPKRLRERGWNQSWELVRELSSVPGQRHCRDGLQRVVEVSSQVGLGPLRRRRNSEGTFEVTRKWRERLKGARVLLVDDVMTTGGTAHACALALREGGVVRVDVLTLCRALW